MAWRGGVLLSYLLRGRRGGSGSSSLHSFNQPSLDGAPRSQTPTPRPPLATMPDLYYMALSPPCRSVLLTAKAVGVELNLKKVDMMSGEHMKPEFLEINFQHTIPTLVDGSIKLWESRAICSYLASQYGKDDSLYPNNPRARCIVDARLNFDMGTLYRRFADFAYPAMRGQKPDPANLEKLKEALGWLNRFLTEYTFAAGNKVTIADHCLISSVSTIEAIGIELDEYTRIVKWMKRCKIAMPGYKEANVDGAEMIGSFLKKKFEELKVEVDP
ncbi:glutathione S-transferase 1-like isoform X2 [Eriocheir sinensis]|uniref:glutathione S-transferase 1-like isoform X2 n=2 Tax=Eriocheir sinensis TaxID=95602 RepID=UPI0021C9087B|nr:glutathione S-transferase 1-like isoform X2 [Eriocheir sinensis]